MDNVFIVTYEETDWDYHRFEVLEVFKNRVSAETYILNFPHDDDYNVSNFYILEKALWG